MSQCEIVAMSHVLCCCSGVSAGGYQMIHSAGRNAGGLSFSSSGHAKVQIDGNYETFHRDDITEHKRPGRYYTILYSIL